MSSTKITLIVDVGEDYADTHTDMIVEDMGIHEAFKIASVYRGDLAEAAIGLVDEIDSGECESRKRQVHRLRAALGKGE